MSGRCVEDSDVSRAVGSKVEVVRTKGVGAARRRGSMGTIVLRLTGGGCRAGGCRVGGCCVDAIVSGAIVWGAVVWRSAVSRLSCQRLWGGAAVR